MADKNKIKLIIGLTFLVISFLCIIVVIYFMGQSNQKNAERIASLEVQLVNIISEKSQEELAPEDAKKVERKTVDLQDLLSKAEILYGPEELKRTEGVLWVDRKDNNFIMTLGMVNGVTVGSRISVYEQDKKFGEIEVQKVLDIISYVKPIDKELKDFSSNYYRVSLSKTP